MASHLPCDGRHIRHRSFRGFLVSMNRALQIWTGILTGPLSGKLAALGLSLALGLASVPVAAQSLPGAATGTRVQLASINIPADRSKGKTAGQLVTVSFMVNDPGLGEKLCRLAPRVFDVLHIALSRQLHPNSSRAKSLPALEMDLLRSINENLKFDYVQSVRLELVGKPPPWSQTTDGCWVLKKKI